MRPRKNLQMLLNSMPSGSSWVGDINDWIEMPNNKLAWIAPVIFFYSYPYAEAQSTFLGDTYDNQ